ncbi:unnamed protein product [Adineta ricciae]|uniref:Uncharacterized protein n=1 Tax=Adineta ricciae TaxID=249248 RepID=A0A814HJI7_ADIRI|nr:unnamed protein product [Adineta ricciae]CAF1010888.1 unnamed protein product [Adineta ricciae]
METHWTIAISLFLILYSLQWLYITHSCDNQVLQSYTNRSKWSELESCFALYSSFGLAVIVAKLSFGLSQIYDDPTHLLMLSVTQAFDVIHKDLKQIFNELWTCLSNGLTKVYEMMTLLNL